MFLHHQDKTYLKVRTKRWRVIDDFSIRNEFFSYHAII